MKKIIQYSVLTIVIGVELLATQKSMAQVSGTINIPGNYPTITAALNQINTVGLSGPAILELQPEMKKFHSR